MRTRILVILILFAASISAQRITGKLISDQGEAVPYAAILLATPSDSSLVKATTSLEDGTFLFKEVASGAYLLIISSLGFSDFQKQINLANTDLPLGSIIVSAATEQLNEVEVVSKKPIIQVLADKTVFNVQNTINATGTSAFELLRKAPGVIIDNNGGIVLEGKSGVQIFIDGRISVLQGQDLANYLESLQATDIEAVEIITQPSSKYDAAGNAGIINIKLKKDKSLGTNGSSIAGLTVGDFARTNSSINFNNREKKGNLYGTYSNRFGKSTGFFDLLRMQSGTQLLARTRSIYDGNTNNVKLGYDHYASEKSTIGLVLNGNFNTNFSENFSRTPIRPIGSILNDSVLVSDNRSSSTSYNINGNINYKYTDTLGYSLNLDLDFAKYASDRESLQPNVYFNGDENQVISQNATSQNTPIDIAIATFVIDYEQNLFIGKLGLGLKFSNVNTNNIFDFFTGTNGDFLQDFSRSNRFEYAERINAGYLNYNYKWEKWNVQAGLRGEHTFSNGNLMSNQQNDEEQVKRRYLNWFPSGGLTYQLDEKNQFALTYSRRIQRPTYESLNPFEYVIDDLYFSKGNPFLQPQYTDNFKVSHTYKYSLTTSISYSYVSDYFARVTLPQQQNRSFITTRNVADQEVINFGVSYPKQINEWWNVYLSLNGYSSSFKAIDTSFISIKQATVSLYAQNTFSLDNGLTMELSGWYSSPSVWGATYTIKALGSVNIAFQKRFLDNRLNARLAFNDILYTIPWQGTTEFDNLFISATGGSDSRQVAFSLSFDFGRNQIKKPRNRKTGLEEEQDRL